MEPPGLKEKSNYEDSLGLYFKSCMEPPDYFKVQKLHGATWSL